MRKLGEVEQLDVECLKFYDKLRNIAKREKNSLTLPISRFLSDLIGSVVKLVNGANSYA